MTLDEGEIFLLVGLEGFELSVLPASLVLFEMSCDVIGEEGLQDVELKIVGIVELLAFLSLKEVVGTVLVAVLYHILLELLLSEDLLLKDDTVFKLKFGSLKNI